MSGRNRHEGAKLRAKYARVFGVPLESVELTELEDERCEVRATGLPVWTTDGPPTGWAPDGKRAQE